jgi:hypothetical protein
MCLGLYDFDLVTFLRPGCRLCILLAGAPRVPSPAAVSKLSNTAGAKYAGLGPKATDLFHKVRVIIAYHI